MTVVVALLTCVAGSVYAGSDERRGTGGALELRLPVGPRGTALGGAVVGDARGIDALFWNPAGLATIERTEAMFSHTEYFANMDLNFAAIGTHTDWGVIAFNAKVLSIGNIIVTTEDAPDGTGEILDPTFSILGVSYAKRFTDRVLFGLTTNYVNERIRNVSATGVSFDFGVQYDTGFRGLRIGMAMKNLGPTMQFKGDDFNTSVQPPGSDPTSTNRILSASSSSFEQPSYFTIAAAYDLLNNATNRFQLLSSFQNNNFVGDNFTGGAEWSYKETFALRGSWFGSVTNPLNTITGERTTDFRSGDDLYNGLSFGAGAQLKSGDTRIGVDMAYKTVRNFFDDTVEVALKLTF